MKKMILRQVLLVVVCMLHSSSQAQSLKDLFSRENIEKVVNTVTGKSTSIDMTGTWTYKGTALEFESDNLLQKAGGSVAAGTIESKLNEQLAKIGIKEGQMSFTFNTDSTFTTQINKRKLSGTYSYDVSTKKVNLKFSKLISFNATMNCTSTTMDILFDADKLLKIVTYLASKSSNSTLNTISSLASSYDGMLLGFSLEKQQ